MNWLTLNIFACNVAITFHVISGCILAELYTGYPLFPGENEVEQLACIMELINLPSEELINQATRRRLFFGKLIIESALFVFCRRRR